MRPEVELLIACARTRISSDTSKRIETLARANSDWPYLLVKASQHGIRPLLFRSLNAVCPDIVPGSVLKDLRAFSLDNSARSLMLTAELVHLLNGFKDQGISAIPFKGPALASWAYGDPALRESNDLDILILKRSLRAASEFLTNQGYRRHLPVPGEGNARYHIFTRDESGANVDLQPSLEAPHFSFALDPALWDRAVSRRLAGQAVLSFCAEDLLILLCVHGTKDVWGQLKWICDIAELIDRDHEIDWDHIVDQARRLHAKRRFLLGCFLGYRLLGAELPAHILHNAFREPTVTSSAEKVIARLSVADPTYTDFERVSLYFRTDDTFRDRMKRYLRYVVLYLRVLAVPSEDDRRFLRTAGWPSGAGYLVRPVRLLAKYGTRPHEAAKALRAWFGSMN